MKTINLFKKEIPYKDYDCSFNKINFTPREAIFNLYIQITNICNAKCKFCEKAGNNSKDEEFDFIKFEKILMELTGRNLLSKIAITGGEPLLNIEKLDNLLNSIKKINKNIYISINTNGTLLGNFNRLKYKQFVDEIVISRHHYRQEINDDILKKETATIKNIGDFITNNKDLKVNLNCVLTKDLIDTPIKAEEYLNKFAEVGVNEVRFIGMLDLVESNKDIYINPETLIKYMNKNVNIGMMYDKEICECFGFIHVSPNGKPIEAFVRNTKKSKCQYLRQLVYDSNNNLLTGFNSQIII